jgi:hypothetical protein
MNYYTIKSSDVGAHSLALFGRVVPVSSFMGRIFPFDVGKRIYDTGDGVVQVENNEQFNARGEAETRRRENLQKPTRDYPGAVQMMRWQRDYK